MSSKKLKIEPISLFSHELKTPLSSLKLAVHLLEENCKSEQDKETIKLMSDEIDRMIHLVCNHLDLKILNEKKDLIKLEWHPWNQVASKVITNFKFLSQEKNITLKVNADSEFEAFIDPFWLAQALENLLSNAIKFSPKNSEILIDYKLKKEGFECSVTNPQKDEGSQEEELFLKNTGLGLAITKMIIENHGGSLKAHSDKNIKFSFFIPKAQLIKASA